jgi:transcriptional regulator with XRE-family HTH domain/tetratricopeptide (TPR) repeat protein
MEGKRGRGRPLTPLDPSASASALLGAKLRARRIDKGLTLKQLAALIGFSQQHISEVERAKSTPGQPFMEACDSALDANGALLELLPAVTEERRQRCEDRSTARRITVDPALRYEAHSDAGEDVEPTNRRGLLGAGAAAAIGLGTAAAPAAAREVDPELPAHLAGLLRLLGRHDEMFGPRDVLSVVRRELRRIAEHRQAARGELRTALVRAEARWTEFSSWLGSDAGDAAGRDALAERALRLAREGDDPDMAAFVRARQSEWATDTQRALAFAEGALSVRGVGAQTRAWCSRQAAISYAMAGDADACERRLADAYALLDDAESASPPWASELRVGRAGTLAVEARCWALLDPRKAIRLYDDALRDWPRTEVRDGAIQRMRLALACAAAGERDRAEAEGRRALALAQATKSASAFRELRQLGVALNMN